MWDGSFVLEVSQSLANIIEQTTDDWIRIFNSLCDDIWYVHQNNGSDQLNKWETKWLPHRLWWGCQDVLSLVTSNQQQQQEIKWYQRNFHYYFLPLYLLSSYHLEGNKSCICECDRAATYLIREVYLNPGIIHHTRV